MRVAVTGGTGFIGSRLVTRLHELGHECRLLARGATEPPPSLSDVDIVRGDVRDTASLETAVEDCAAVAHLAGINHERGDQSFQGVHVAGTRAVCDAAEAADVDRLLLTSYLRARPDCGSGYLESKWAAERLVRTADCPHTVVKPGLVYGRGDQLLTNVSRALATVPLFPRVGLAARQHRPLAVDDLVDVLAGALVGERLRGDTVPVLGPETLSLAELVERIAAASDRRVWTVPTPVALLSVMAWIQEQTMDQPAVSRAAVRMLAEGSTDPAPPGIYTKLPDDLEPTQPFSRSHLAAQRPAVDRYGLGDLRWP